ncbi:Centromere protein Cenp-H [Niveomyces insectorum RCEF 264]|uniref:Centromere protein Cenp-H n=1 Tax=Niveomyces insectorum RCEF 264 TaxID=1081102 RepID=A0A162K5Z6_9HYPO|nr:Centromere protein Cenp-H [Niveomyces insectorum RCEF 264]
MAASQQDMPMDDAPDAVAKLVLSEEEKHVLTLYDRLRALQLEVALLKARQSYDGDTSSSSLKNVEAAQKQLLDARAAYVLRNEAVDGVLTVQPILKAVHRATQASPIERDLLPAVEGRDAASQALAEQENARRAVLDEQATVAAESRRVERRNAQLAAQVRALLDAAEAETATTTTTTTTAADERHATELAQLEADVKASRQRWKLIKGTASAIVVGSGVDWARDASLRDIVLDPE